MPPDATLLAIPAPSSLASAAFPSPHPPRRRQGVAWRRGGRRGARPLRRPRLWPGTSPSHAQGGSPVPRASRPRLGGCRRRPPGVPPSCPQVENVVHHTALTRAHTCTHAHTPRSAQVHIPTGSISGAGSCPSSGCTENRRYARSPEKSHVVSRLISQRVKTGACKTHLSQVFAVSTFVA